MKLYEKIIIIFAILAGCAAIVIILTMTLSTASVGKDLSLSSYQAPRENQALITYLSGSIFIFRDKAWKTAALGELLKDGDHVRTFENSFCEIQVGDRLVFIVEENTVVRLDDMLHSGSSLRSECELIVGALLCKVEKLAGSEKVSVRAGNRAFGVRGTEFLIERQAGETNCAVKDGRVAILAFDTGTQLAVVAPGQEVRIDEMTGRLSAQIAVSASRKTMLDRLAAAKTISTAKEDEAKLVKIAIEVEPTNAEILLDGTFAGYGSYAGIYQAGTQLPVTLKKAGYKEQSFSIPVKQGDNRIYVFKLELDAPEAGISLKKQTDEYELRIERLETDVRRLSSEKEALSRDLEAVNRKLNEVRNVVK